MASVEYGDRWSHEKPPALSVCIPTYNPNMKYLAELLGSLRDQTFSDFEVVVTDDDSQNAIAIRQLLADCGLPWMAVWSEVALGMAKNWNRSVDYARGKYAVVTGQDDLFSSTGIERLVQTALESNAALVFGAQSYVNGASAPIPNPSKSISGCDIFPDAPMLIGRETLVSGALLYGNVFGDPCNTLISTSHFRQSGGFSLVYQHAVDLELWLRIAQAGATVIRIPDQVASHRTHSNAATGGHVRNGAAQRDRERLVKDYGVGLVDTRTWNRAIARLRSHRTYDRLVHSTKREGLTVRMKGSLLARSSAVVRDLAEMTRLASPRIPSDRGEKQHLS